LAESKIEELENYDEGPGGDRGVGIAWVPSSPVPAAPVYGSCDNTIRDLRNDSSCSKGEPAVDLRVCFAALEYVSRVEVSWLQLLDERRCDSQSHKNAEKTRLHVDLAVAEVPEGKRIKQTSDDVQYELAYDVLRTTPIRSE